MPKMKKVLQNDCKMATFAAGTGTVLFFEDQNVVKGLQEQFPSYAENFPIWAEHSAIAQFSTWTALHTEGLGASLQHYNPIVDEQVHAEMGYSENWKLRAQLVFGSVEGEARAKIIWKMINASKFSISLISDLSLIIFKDRSSGYL